MVLSLMMLEATIMPLKKMMKLPIFGIGRGETWWQ
jgi:hypothetical protein